MYKTEFISNILLFQLFYGSSVFDFSLSTKSALWQLWQGLNSGYDLVEVKQTGYGGGIS